MKTPEDIIYEQLCKHTTNKSKEIPPEANITFMVVSAFETEEGIGMGFELIDPNVKLPAKSTDLNAQQLGFFMARDKVAEVLEEAITKAQMFVKFQEMSTTSSEGVEDAVKQLLSGIADELKKNDDTNQY